MLKKLLKYEWKSVSVMLLLIHGILLVYTLIGRIGLGIAVNTTGESWGNSVANIYGISAGFYILVYEVGPESFLPPPLPPFSIWQCASNAACFPMRAI